MLHVTYSESNTNLGRLKLISSTFDLNLAFFVPNKIPERERHVCS